MLNIKTDSRKVCPGDTFVAIKGQIIDGHDFIKQAIDNGATTIVSQKRGKTNKVKFIKVKNTNKYLKKTLVKNYSSLLNDLKIIGITGTNGKTTTAYMTYQLLNKLNIKCAYIGTLGFYYNKKREKTLNTTPDILSLYNMLFKAKENNCNIIIIEASSIGLNEGRLKGLKFHSAVFTNLTHDHLDYHKNMNKYLKAKQILFKNLSKNGMRIVNIDDKYANSFIKRKNTITYGFKNADVLCEKHDKIFKEFTFQIQKNKWKTSNPMIGKYNIYNILASIGILISLDIDISKINKLIPTLEPPKGRMNIINYQNNKIIIDYAHTPDGVNQIITSTQKITKGNIYIVFGCPGDRDRTKRPIIGLLVSKYAKKFIITNDDPHYEDENQIVNDITENLIGNNYEIILDRKKAIEKAISFLQNNDTLLILGKGHENEIIIKDKKIPHNDEKVVKNSLNKKRL